MRRDGERGAGRVRRGEERGGKVRREGEKQTRVWDRVGGWKS